jgi:hypothetical protein
MSLESIERLTKEHAADRELLAERVRALHEEIDAAKRRRLAGIKSAVSKARDSRLRLASAIEHSKGVFDKPRTRVLHGIKVGLQKAKGRLTFMCADKVVELIRKHFAEQADVLIKVKETPVKSALQQLPAADLKKLGCAIEDCGDAVVIEPINTDIDELVDALLGKDDDDDGEEAAA